MIGVSMRSPRSCASTAFAAARPSSPAGWWIVDTWLADGVVLRGAMLADGVLPMPLLAPGNAVILHARAV